MRDLQSRATLQLRRIPTWGVRQDLNLLQSVPQTDTSTTSASDSKMLTIPKEKGSFLGFPCVAKINDEVLHQTIDAREAKTTRAILLGLMIVVNSRVHHKRNSSRKSGENQTTRADYSLKHFSFALHGKHSTLFLFQDICSPKCSLQAVLH